MALDSKALAALALHRFGFGPRAGTIDAIASDPRGALLADLDRPEAGQIANADLVGGAQAPRAVFESTSERNAKERVARKQREAEKARAVEAGMEAAPANEAMAEPKPQEPLQRRIFLQEAQARMTAAITAE